MTRALPSNSPRATWKRHDRSNGKPLHPWNTVRRKPWRCSKDRCRAVGYDPSDSLDDENVTSSVSDALAFPEMIATYEEDAGMQSKYRNWRIWIFAMIWLSYMVYYLTRGSFTYAAPTMVKDLGWSLKEVGRITTVFPLMYGCSKFASGVLVDVLGSRTILALGLVASGTINILFGTQSALLTLALLWGANGFFQGFGGPSCAKLLTTWYPSEQRGTWWAAWTTSNNVGGFIVPLMVGSISSTAGWRVGMTTPGVIAIVAGVIVYFGVRNKPKSVELPSPHEKSSNKQDSDRSPTQEVTASPSDIVFKYVFPNRAIWALAFAYFFVYIVRQGMVSWSHFYLMAEKGIPDAAQASATVSGLELGGLVGAMVSGWLSDKVQGHRIRVVMGYCLGLVLALLAFRFAPSGNQAVNAFLVATVGFFIYGPQMLIGLIGAELSHPVAVATGNGLLGWIAYLGAAFAGEPLAILVNQFGWKYYFLGMISCCALPIILLAPFWNARKYEDVC